MRFKVVYIFFLLFISGGSLCLADNEIPKVLKEKISTYRYERDIIRIELLAQLKNTNLKTPEEKILAVKSWQDKNAKRIEKMKSLAQNIRQQLQKEIKDKIDQLNDLPPEQSSQQLQTWLNDNNRYLTVVDGNKSLEFARKEYREKARERIDKVQQEAKETIERSKDKAEFKQNNLARREEKERGNSEKAREDNRNEKDKDNGNGNDKDKDKDKDNGNGNGNDKDKDKDKDNGNGNGNDKDKDKGNDKNKNK